MFLQNISRIVVSLIYLQNIVPLIRVSEMYYIAAEAANAKGDIAGGSSLLK